ncbi:anti-sigma factor [Serinibacter arcticus]|uniref:Anti-sigma factor n=1 Tax=Serinibacter arcticus TaxID=1655435 RepID=A0A2U1ZW10_9MICO|nr:anti-sigma factor [Serinibacter arcticus]PWD51176.1 anti-sigma factor [Serinibacter arcticus]
MPHSDPEDLALVALGEAPSPTDAEHLDICELCRAELASLTDVVDGARVVAPLVAPPARVWDRIAAQIADESDGAPELSPAPAAPVARPDDARPLPAPVPLDARRRRARLPLLVAASAAAGAAVVLGVQAVLPDPTPAVVQLASASLEPLPGWDASGSAVLEEVDGGPVLRVDLPDDVPNEGYREVWLISTDLQRLVSLGVLTGDAGSFDLPPGIDVADFAIVDISDEPVNGDPAHSGASIVRGQLA